MGLGALSIEISNKIIYKPWSVRARTFCECVNYPNWLVLSVLPIFIHHINLRVPIVPYQQPQNIGPRHHNQANKMLPDRMPQRNYKTDRARLTVLLAMHTTAQDDAWIEEHDAFVERRAKRKFDVSDSLTLPNFPDQHSTEHQKESEQKGEKFGGSKGTSSKEKDEEGWVDCGRRSR